jgi:hypothetical protein
MNLSKVIYESRESDFLKKYRTKFSTDDAKKIYLLSRDLSSNHKYLDFIGKVTNNENIDENLELVKNTIQKFIKYQTQLDEKDINKYEDLSDVIDAIKNHENKVKRSVTKLDDAEIVYEDNQFTVINPKNHKASCYYGAGTKWCTAAKDNESHFNTYNVDGKLFYIIDKTAKSSDPFYKVALLLNYDGEKKYFDAKDNEFKDGWLLGTSEWREIEDNIVDFLNTVYAEQIEIFKDEERAQQERERQRRIIERERYNRLMEGAQIRRESEEWNLDENNDDEYVRRINALFDVLKTELNIVSESEDIYYLIPTNDTYELSGFIWMGEEDFETEYIVGDWDSAYETAKNLQHDILDDLGLEGWNEDFVELHIDLDSVREFFEEFFEEDVMNNIEVYFEDEHRNLSSSQKREINKIMQKINELDEIISNSEDEDEISDAENEIEELQMEYDEIMENPEGDPDEDMINTVITDLVNDYMKDPVGNLKDYVGDYTSFVNIDELIESTLESDGISQTLARYDGLEYESKIGNTWYFVYRVG